MCQASTISSLVQEDKQVYSENIYSSSYFATVWEDLADILLGVAGPAQQRHEMWNHRGILDGREEQTATRNLGSKHMWQSLFTRKYVTKPLILMVLNKVSLRISKTKVSWPSELSKQGIRKDIFIFILENKIQEKELNFSSGSNQCSCYKTASLQRVGRNQFWNQNVMRWLINTDNIKWLMQKKCCTK